jgi:hypothetical protein
MMRDEDQGVLVTGFFDEVFNSEWRFDICIDALDPYAVMELSLSV